MGSGPESGSGTSGDPTAGPSTTPPWETCDTAVGCGCHHPLKKTSVAPCYSRGGLRPVAPRRGIGRSDSAHVPHDAWCVVGNCRGNSRLSMIRGSAVHFQDNKPETLSFVHLKNGARDLRTHVS